MLSSLLATCTSAVCSLAMKLCRQVSQCCHTGGQAAEMTHLRSSARAQMGTSENAVRRLRTVLTDRARAVYTTAIARGFFTPEA